MLNQPTNQPTWGAPRVSSMASEVCPRGLGAFRRPRRAIHGIKYDPMPHTSPDILKDGPLAIYLIGSENREVGPPVDW